MQQQTLQDDTALVMTPILVHLYESSTSLCIVLCKYSQCAAAVSLSHALLLHLHVHYLL
jgi:hypothetical protein